jgi:hypothetical protein
MQRSISPRNRFGGGVSIDSDIEFVVVIDTGFKELWPIAERL